MGREPRPIAVTLIEMRHVANPGDAREHSFRYEGEGVERHGRWRLRVLKGTHGVAPEDWKYEAPIMLSGAKALALLVPQSFYPLVVTDSEIGSVLSQASHSG
jgi:hypothetical protein